MKRYAKMFTAMLSGLGAAVTVFSTPVFSRPVGSDLSRMRGDVERVGATMRAIIDREHEREASKKYTGQAV